MGRVGWLKFGMALSRGRGPPIFASTLVKETGDNKSHLVLALVKGCIVCILVVF